MGNYTEYRTRKQPIVLDIPTSPISSRQKNESNGSVAAARIAPAPAKAKGKKGGKVKERTLEDVEREIEQAEERVRSVEEALSQAALNADASQLTQLAADYEQGRVHVDKLLVEWERLAETASE